MNVWILADISRDVPGGMLRHMELHAEGLRRLGHQATVFCAGDFVTSGLPAVDARVPGLRSLAALLARARRELPDIVNVHSTSAPAWIAAQRIGLLGRARVVVMSYGADERAAPVSHDVRGVLRRLRLAVPMRTMLPLASGVWCVNTEDQAFIRQRYRLPDARVAVIPHGVDDLFYAPRPAASGQPPSQRADQLLFVGTWIPRKGTEILRRALPDLLNRHPSLQVALAGTILGEADVRAALAGAPAERVTVHPRISPAALRDLYDDSTLQLVPSEVEGLPIVLLEAMACGCPSLSAANSGMADVLREGENGWLLSSRDPAVWSARIDALLGAPAALARAGAGARASAERFRLDRVTAEALAWYARLA